MKKHPLPFTAIAAAAIAVWCLGLAVALASAPHLPPAAAQRWVQGDRAILAIDPRDPNGQLAAARIDIGNFSTDFHFDPRALDKSRLILSAAFLPRRGADTAALLDQTTPQEILRNTSALFISERIRKMGENTFIADGLLHVRARKQALSMHIDARFVGRDRDNRPLLAFSGAFQAPLGQMIPAYGFPPLVPLHFYVEAIPVP